MSEKSLVECANEMTDTDRERAIYALRTHGCAALAEALTRPQFHTDAAEQVALLTSERDEWRDLARLRGETKTQALKLGAEVERLQAELATANQRIEAQRADLGKAAETRVELEGKLEVMSDAAAIDGRLTSNERKEAP